MTAEELGGRGKCERAQERGGKREPTTRMRAPSFCISQACASDRAPSADGADVRGGGARRPFPTPRGLKSGWPSLAVAGRHLFLQCLFGKQGTGASLLSPLLFRSPPPRIMGWELLGVSGRVRSRFSRPL